MSWVRCWHPSMRRLQWCLWWTMIWVGMRDDATSARPWSSWGAIQSWHDGSFFWDPMRTFTIMEKFVRILMVWISSCFSTTKMIGTHFFSTIFWDVKNGCLTTPGADSGRLWEVFQKPHLFCPFGYWTDDPVSVADAWSILKLCQLCDSEVEIDGFFSLPHARESRFSSDSVKIWRGSSCLHNFGSFQGSHNSQGETSGKWVATGASYGI